MWSCPKCGERHEDGLAVCWNCGTAADGTEDPDFGADAPPARRAADRPARTKVAELGIFAVGLGVIYTAFVGVLA